MSKVIDKNKSKYVTYFSILLAFVVIFQVFGGYIKIGATSFSFVLVPIVLGGIVLGPIAGLSLGVCFSLVVIVMGLMGGDSFTGILLNDAPVQTIAVVTVKGALCGYIPAVVYKFISKKNKTLATVVASVLSPVINTSVFIVGMLTISDVLSKNFVPSGMSVIYFLVIGCAGINFIVELALNIILSPSIVKFSDYLLRKAGR